jgi:xylulokinase
MAVSLGTSDVIFGLMREPRVDPNGAGHVFGAATGDFMSLTVFKNGSLARERIRDAYGLDWDGFSRLLLQTPAGNNGRVLLPWFEPEITPAVVAPGEHRYRLDPGDAASNVRAVVEAQMMAMALHSRWMGVEIDTIYATGGASANRAVLQVMADVFGAEVYQMEVGNSAALGAALRAFHADVRADGRELSWDEVIDGFVSPVEASRVTPEPERHAAYRALLPIYASCEAHALGKGADPAPALEAFAARRTFSS